MGFGVGVVDVVGDWVGGWQCRCLSELLSDIALPDRVASEMTGFWPVLGRPRFETLEI